MDIQVLASGSTGNSYKISNGDTTLLVECGIPFKDIQKKLKFKLSSVDGCLITHSHKDHAKVVKDMLKNSINCYMSKGTAEELQVKGHRVNILTQKEDVYNQVLINSFCVKPFKTIHDTKEPVGFLIKDMLTSETLVFVTDSAYVPYKFNKINYLMVECNYVKSVIDKNVENGSIDIHLRNRIVKTHMGLETLIDFLESNDLSNLRKIYLMHLSENNSDERVIKETVQKITGKSVIVC